MRDRHDAAGLARDHACPRRNDPMVRRDFNHAALARVMLRRDRLVSIDARFVDWDAVNASVFCGDRSRDERTGMVVGGRFVCYRARLTIGMVRHCDDNAGSNSDRIHRELVFQEDCIPGKQERDEADPIVL